MNVGFYTARAGLLTMQQGLDIVSNNIANQETNGYKALRPSFSDLLYTAQQPQNAQSQTGHGVRTTKTDLMYERGQLQLTNRTLDFATPSDGFFATQNASGDINYTKDGAFSISKNGAEWQLVNSQGNKVLDYDKNPIILKINANGEIDGDYLINKLGIFKFENPFGLEANGTNSYTQTKNSGEGIADTDLVKLAGSLESSSVDIGTQMIKVIELQRGFQLNSKMVQTADEIEGIVNNLR